MVANLGHSKLVFYNTRRHPLKQVTIERYTYGCYAGKSVGKWHLPISKSKKRSPIKDLPVYQSVFQSQKQYCTAWFFSMFGIFD